MRTIGDYREWSQAGDSGAIATFRFCAICGATVSFVNAALPGTIAVPVGAFADPAFPSPRVSIYEDRKHRWVAIVGDEVEHLG